MIAKTAWGTFALPTTAEKTKVAMMHLFLVATSQARNRSDYFLPPAVEASRKSKRNQLTQSV